MCGHSPRSQDFRIRSLLSSPKVRSVSFRVSGRAATGAAVFCSERPRELCRDGLLFRPLCLRLPRWLYRRHLRANKEFLWSQTVFRRQNRLFLSRLFAGWSEILSGNTEALPLSTASSRLDWENNHLCQPKKTNDRTPKLQDTPRRKKSRLPCAFYNR